MKKTLILLFCFTCLYKISITQTYNFNADSFVNIYKANNVQATFQRYLNSKGINVPDQYIKFMKNNAGKDTAIYDTIVLVFHILVHESTQKLFTDAEISKYLDTVIMDINDVYNGNKAMKNGIDNYFKLKNGNSHIFFMKAKTDPYGNSTPGFTRVSTSSLELYSDVNANSIDKNWDPRYYINVYLNNRGPRDMEGIATGLETKEGYRMTHARFDKTKANSNTVAHEIGHFLGLPHTFEPCKDVTENPSDINIQDVSTYLNEVCNFPSTNTLCDKSNVSTEMYNMMSYSVCGMGTDLRKSTFTKGQSFIMLSGLYNLPLLKSLKSSNRYLAPNERMNEPFIVSIDSNVQNSCDSIQLGVNIKNIGGNNISSMLIGVYYSDTILHNSFLWNGNLAIGQTMNIPLGFKIYNANLPLSIKILKVNNKDQVEHDNPFAKPTNVVLSKVMNFELANCPYAKQYNDIKLIDFTNMIDAKIYDSMQLNLSLQNASNIGAINNAIIKIYQNYALTDSFIWTGKQPLTARGGIDVFSTPTIKRNGNNIKIVLEKPNGVKDTDTTNNEVTKTITKPMINKYDLAILSYKSSSQCDSFQITTTVQNLGTVASSNIYVNFYQNNTLVKVENLNTLNPGQIAEIAPTSSLDNFITKIVVGQKDKIDEDSTDNIITFYPNCNYKLRNNIAINSDGMMPIMLSSNNCQSLTFSYLFKNIGRNTITNYEIKVYQVKNGKLTDSLYSRTYNKIINVRSNQLITNANQDMNITETFPIVVKDSIAIVFGFPNGIQDEDPTNNTAIFFLKECFTPIYNFDVSITNLRLTPGETYCSQISNYSYTANNLGKITPGVCLVDITCNVEDTAANSCNKKNYNFNCDFYSKKTSDISDQFPNYNQSFRSFRYSNLRIVVGSTTYADQNPSNDTFTFYRLPCIDKSDIYIYNLANQNTENCDSSTLSFKVKNLGMKPVSIFTANVYVGGVLKFKERVEYKNPIPQYIDSPTFTLNQKIKYQDAVPIKIILTNLQDSLVDSDPTNNADSLIKLTPCLPKISVTFFPQNGADPIVQYYNNGEIIPGIQNTLAKFSYNFVGWSTTKSIDNIIDLSKTPIKNPMVLYAIWKSVNIIVTFNLNGGVGQTPPQQIVAPSTPANPPSTPIPTRDGYYFVCWSDNKNATQDFEAFNFKSNLINDTSIYAIWKKQISILIFDSNYNANGENGSVLVKSLGYNEIYNSPLPNLTRQGFTLKGWSLKYNDTNLVDVSKLQIKENIKLYAVWKTASNSYTLTFNINGGTSTAPATQTIQKGNKGTKPINPIRKGYNFIMWGNAINSSGADSFSFSNKIIDTNYTVYAIWQAQTNTLTFNINGGTSTAPATQNITSGNKGTKPTDPTRQGYKFLMWGNTINSSGADSFSFNNKIIDTNYTVYAIWQALNSYTLTFNINGGTSTAPVTQNITSGNKGTKPADPSRQGYKFIMWGNTINSSGADSFSFSNKVIDTNYTVYAIWQAQTNTLTFNINGGTSTAPATQNITSGNKGTKPTDPTRQGYKFIMWGNTLNSSGADSFSFNNKVIDTNYTVYAIWQAQTNTLTFNINGGTSTAPATQNITSGNKGTKPADPTRQGYKFIMWGNTINSSGADSFSFSNKIIDTNYTVYAIWQALNSYTLTFNINGGTSTAPATQNITSGNKGTKPADPSRQGYKFIMWGNTINSSGADSFSFSNKVIDTNYTVYAIWQAQTNTLTFNINGGTSTAPATQNITSGNKGTKPADPTRQGYKFIMWGNTINSSGADSFSFSNKIIDTNYTVYAIWQALNSYTLTFNINGGTSTAPATQNITSGNKGTKPADPSRQGYKFIMWGNTINSSGADSFSFSNKVIDTNYTVYAIWQAQTNTLTFNINGGTSTAPVTQNITSGNKGTKPADPTRQGYKFIMWGNTINSSGADSFSFNNKIIDTNYTVYAIWQALNSYTLTFNINGGTSTAPATQNITSGNKGTKPINPIRKGYNFIMWGNTINSVAADSFSFSNKIIDTNYTVYAIWQAQTNTLTFNINGGTSTAPATQNITSGNKGTKPADPTKQGYKFIMWGNTINSSGADSFSFSNKVIDTNYTVYAIWQALNSYTLTFNINGGTSTAPATQNITSGNKGTKPADPTKQGYKFIMWGNTINSSGADSFSFNNKIIDTNYTVYAIWQAQTNTLTFNINGGTSTSPATQNITSGNKGTKPADPTRQGYKFIMWGNTINSSGADSFSFSNKIIDTNYTVYAIWQALNSYTLTFNINGGTSTAPATQNITSGNKGTKPADPSRQGYKFIMWGNTINSSGADSFSFSNKVIDTNYTVYAIWEINLDYIDVSLDSIVGPFNCDSFKLKIATTNKSQVALTKMEINVYINNKLTETYLWTGNLKLNEKTIIEMKNSVIKIRDKIIKVIISKPNDVIDKNPIDNESIKTKDDCMLQVPDFKNSKPDMFF